MAPQRATALCCAKQCRSKKVSNDKVTKSKSTVRKAQQALTFLSTLPQELLDIIYDESRLDINKVHVLPKGKGVVTTDHTWMKLCRQTRKQFGDVLSKTTPNTANKIIAHVYDFNFGPLLAFLKRADLNTLRGFDGNGRELVVEFTLSLDWCNWPDLTALNHWLKWLGQKEEEQYWIEVIYVVKEVEDGAPVKQAIANLDKETCKDILTAFDIWLKYGEGEDDYDREMEEYEQACAEANARIDSEKGVLLNDTLGFGEDSQAL